MFSQCIDRTSDYVSVGRRWQRLEVNHLVNTPSVWSPQLYDARMHDGPRLHSSQMDYLLPTPTAHFTLRSDKLYIQADWNKRRNCSTHNAHRFFLVDDVDDFVLFFVLIDVLGFFGDSSVVTFS